MMTVKHITTDDDLNWLVDEINQAHWDDANEMSKYDVNTLSAYLEREDTLFVACHDIAESGRTLLGISSSKLESKAYDKTRWLYVDEVDVCADQRQKGVGKAIMQKLLELAKEFECEVVWLATEAGNHAANSLYRSLDPNEVEQVIGYTYEI